MGHAENPHAHAPAPDDLVALIDDASAAGAEFRHHTTPDARREFERVAGVVAELADRAGLARFLPDKAELSRRVHYDGAPPVEFLTELNLPGGWSAKPGSGPAFWFARSVEARSVLPAGSGFRVVLGEPGDAREFQPVTNPQEWWQVSMTALWIRAASTPVATPGVRLAESVALVEPQVPAPKVAPSPEPVPAFSGPRLQYDIDRLTVTLERFSGYCGVVSAALEVVAAFLPRERLGRPVEALA